MSKVGFADQIRVLAKLRKAIIDLCPRLADGDIGQPFKSWVEALDKQTDQARRWLGTDKQPPQAPMGAGGDEEPGAAALSCADGMPLQEKRPESHLSASSQLNKAFSEAVQDQPPQSRGQLLPLLCRVLLLK